MFAAAHLDNFLFLLFIAVAIFFQLLTRAAKTGRRTRRDVPRAREGSASSPQTPRPTTAETEQTDEDRIRKFLEALGQPTTSKPPPPVVPRPTYQRPVVLPRVPSPMKSPLPPLKARPPELPPEVRVPSQPAPAQQRKVFPPTSEVPTFEVQEGSPPPLMPISESEGTAAFQPVTPAPISKRTEPKIDLSSMLKSPSGLRDAIILREVFGPPRSMQPLDLVGNV